MIYVLDQGGSVLLGGTVASADMLRLGYKPYYGKVPSGTAFKFDANGWLVAIPEEDLK